MTIISGLCAGQHGSVDSNVFQKTVDHPEEYALGCHVVLEDGQVVTVRRDQLKCRKQEPGAVGWETENTSRISSLMRATSGLPGSQARP